MFHLNSMRNRVTYTYLNNPSKHVLPLIFFRSLIPEGGRVPPLFPLQKLKKTEDEMSNEDFIRDLYACDEQLCLCKTPNPRVGFVYSHSQIYREQECQRLLTRSPATSKDHSPTMFSSPPEITCARTICLEVNARLG